MMRFHQALSLPCCGSGNEFASLRIHDQIGPGFAGWLTAMAVVLSVLVLGLSFAPVV